MKLTEKTISSQILHQGKVLNLRIDAVELPNGKIATREIIEHAGAVAIVPLTSAGEIVMVRQYRHPAGEILLEIPAGKLDRDENPEHCAKRELLEETGFITGNIRKIFSCFSSPGFCGELIHIYVATEIIYQGQQLDEDEFLEVEKIPLPKVLAMISSGDIKDIKTIAGVLSIANL